MALPQQLIKDLGGVLEVFLPGRIEATPAPAVTLYDGGGGTTFSAVAARKEEVATTLSAAAAIGARTLSVVSLAGMIAGRKLRIGGTLSPAEDVTVRSVTGTTLSLDVPLLYAHAIGEAVESTRLWLDVTAAQATSLFDNGWASITYSQAQP